MPDLTPEELKKLLDEDDRNTPCNLDNPSTPQNSASLQATIERLNLEKAALVSEFSQNPDGSPNTQASTPAAIRKHLTALVPIALTQLGSLMQHAESENVRSNLSRYVLSIALGDDASDDSINALIESLKPPAPPSS